MERGSLLCHRLQRKAPKARHLPGGSDEGGGNPFRRRRSEAADFNLPEFTRRVFDMYDGETKKVTLVCKNDLMNYIVDRFGDEVDTVPGDCGHFRAVAEVSVSQTFFAWVFQFNGDIRITAPEEVVLQYGEMLKNALQT